MIAGLKNDHLLPRMIKSLWEIANTPPQTTQGKANIQRALRQLLEVRGGVEFVLARPKEEQEELRRRGVCDGPIIISELAGLELERRRLLVALTDIWLPAVNRFFGISNLAAVKIILEGENS